MLCERAMQRYPCFPRPPPDRSFCSNRMSGPPNGPSYRVFMPSNGFPLDSPFPPPYNMDRPCHGRFFRRQVCFFNSFMISSMTADENQFFPGLCL